MDCIISTPTRRLCTFFFRLLFVRSLCKTTYVSNKMQALTFEVFLLREPRSRDAKVQAV